MAAFLKAARGFCVPGGNRAAYHFIVYIYSSFLLPFSSPSPLHPHSNNLVWWVELRDCNGPKVKHKRPKQNGGFEPGGPPSELNYCITPALGEQEEMGEEVRAQRVLLSNAESLQ